MNTMYALFEVTIDWYKYDKLLAVSEDKEKLRLLAAKFGVKLITPEEEEDQVDGCPTYRVIREVVRV